MSTTTVDVLDQITSTLRDAEVGPDAHPIDGGWTPGDPLWPHPWLRGADAQVTREMLQVIDDYARPMRCKPCGVHWAGDSPCWMCGEDRPLGRRQLTGGDENVSLMIRIDTRPLNAALDALAEAFARMQSSVDAAGGWVRLSQRLQAYAVVPVAVGWRYDEHHPRPLCVDGAAYARRRRVQKGRRR